MQNEQLIEWLEENLKRVNLVDSLEQKNGFTRLGFTEEETKAHDEFVSISEELGLTVTEDAIGNKIARWEAAGGSEGAVASGSHLDTVTKGGAYDGAAGIICSLGAIKQLKEENFQPKKPIEVICFRLEESDRFGVSTIGSKAMAGLLNKKDYESVKDKFGVTLKEAIESQGYDWNKIERAARPVNSLSSFLEVHIEQGKRLENKFHLGVVEAVACPLRLDITIHGREGHTGTTLMSERSDALVAASVLISDIYTNTQQLNARQKYPVMATVSKITNEPNVISVIPGKVVLGVDIRSVDDSLKEKVYNRLKEQLGQLEKQFNVDTSVEITVDNKSVFLRQEMKETLIELIGKQQLTYTVLDSRAGHDVMNLAAKWNAGLLFIPCKNGISHHPEEFASINSICHGSLMVSEYYRHYCS